MHSGDKAEEINRNKTMTQGASSSGVSGSGNEMNSETGGDVRRNQTGGGLITGMCREMVQIIANLGTISDLCVTSAKTPGILQEIASCLII